MKKKIDFNYLIIISTIYLAGMLLLKGDYVLSCGVHWRDVVILLTSAVGGLLLYDKLRIKFRRYRWVLVLLVCSVNMLLGILYSTAIC